MMNRFQIGEIARRTGLTVRSIRYYEELGLLEDVNRSESGYRIYELEDLKRLQKICSLKYLGLQLEEIKTCLNDPQYDLKVIIDRQIRQVQTEIEQKHKLHRRLKSLSEYLEDSPGPTVEDLLETLKAMTNFEKYYTPEQLETLENRQKELGEEYIQQVQQQWQDLISRVRRAMDEGTDPSSPEAKQLAEEWESLIREFTGGDPGIRESLSKMYQQEDPETASRGFLDSGVMEFIGKAQKG